MAKAIGRHTITNVLVLVAKGELQPEPSAALLPAAPRVVLQLPPPAAACRL